MRGRAHLRWVVGVSALALTLAACGGDDGGEEGNGAAGGEGEATGGTYSLFITQPENPLVPGNTNESEGSQVIEALFTGLVEYNPETSEAEYTGVAESIESDDATNWTVTLKDGWTFHDGTPVTAESFVNAWNYTAYSPNAQGNAYFFSRFAGYEDLSGETDEEGNIISEPAAEEMSGLQVEDDLTFTVELSEPYAQFPTTLGYNAYFPLPEAFFEDPEGFGEQPIGNGPFQAEEPFVEGQGGTLTRYEDFAGEQPANADSLEIRVYTDVNTAYTDVQAGNLDIVDQIPPDAIGSAPDEFGDRFIERERSDITLIWMPIYDERFADVRVRQAFSLAIDRAAITEAVFNGTREPAKSIISPVVAGAREDACQYCDPDPERANELLDEAGFDRSQTLELWFNAGAGHDEWMQAVGNQIRENLGIEYTLRGDLEFAQYLPLIDEGNMTGPWRLGWIMDYPVAENYLGPLFGTAAHPPAGSNGAFYSNEEFDSLIAEGNAADSEDDAVAAYQQAEDIILEELPAIPMWFGLVQSVHSENIDNVIIDAFGQIKTAQVQVVGG
ncbi:MAG TPA: ABC transporter substrate-binding protein [Jiangellales bacterium]|nr:ABC transporter substrate-binding protein [Jiangellales bacterium]